MTLEPAVSFQDTQAPVVLFDDFLEIFDWRQGQHTAFIGPNGAGKTTLALSLLDKQPYVTVIATKPKDDSMDKLAARGYKIYKKWPNNVKASKVPRRIIWPKPLSLSENQLAQQAKIIHEANAAIYGEGGWCLYVDELWYMVNMLGLSFDVRTFLLQARSLGISFTAATQRPAFVPLEVYDQSTHLFFWRDNDERNLTRLSGISWRSANLVRELIANLEDHQFLYVRNSGEMYRSTANFGREN